MSADRPVRTFLVDDHRLFLAGVRAELSDRAVEIVGTAMDAPSAVAAILETSPEVVLVDVHLPGGGGRAVVEQVLAARPTIRFLALSVSDAAEDVIGLIRAGARGYVTKTIGPDELVDAVRRVRDGDAVFSPRLAGFVLDAFSPAAAPATPSSSPAPAGGAGGGPGPGDPGLEQLTPREAEVLRLIARGYTYRELAQRLDISVKTVETHVSAVLRKLQLSTRHQLARWATDRGLE